MKIIGICICCMLAFAGSAQIEKIKAASDIAQKQISPKTGVNLGMNKLALVNPFIGTGGHGHTYPGAAAPFGMMQLSPDTRFDGWDGCSGYHYSDSIIYGFSHTHLSGTGVSDYGDLLICPQSGSTEIDPGYSDANGYGAHFSHAKEKASPGYYEVHLEEPNIDVRLTASERAGLHEYSFLNASGKKYILIDLDHRDQLISSDIQLVSDTEISGYRVSNAWATKQEFHFYMQLSEPYKKARLIEKDGRHKLLLIFSKKTEKVLIRVGMSAVDSDGAKANVNKEIPNFDFEATQKRVELLWTKELNKILFYTPEQEVMVNFYTALYHSYLNPNVFSDVDGRYRGYDGGIHTLNDPSQTNYTVFSLWDTYRAAHPLFTLTQVKRTNDFINTFLRHYDQKGTLPIWELAGNETGCMIGYHAVSVITDAYAKGIDGFDASKAIEAMISTSNLDELGKLTYARQGFLGVSDEPESVSKTLEYAYDDFCIAEMIRMYSGNMRNEEMSASMQLYNRRAMNFINVFDPSTGFMRGRRSGQWFSPFDPAEVNFNYTEANSWQYSLYAPHAVGVMSNLLGGKKSLESWLDRLFTTESNLSGRHQVDITGLIGQYAHGNEPSHHMAYLYNYTDAPHKTSEYVDQILREMYSNAPDGLSGNEDCGQMSSWYVLSSLGIYPMAPGRPMYEFGRPLIHEGLLQFEDGKRLSITSINNTENAKYIDKILFNDKELKQRYITHEMLAGGGKLVFVMTNKPSENYASYAVAPTLDKVDENFVAVPYFNETTRIIEDELSLSLSTVDKDAVIQYTTDGTDPATSSSAVRYETPFKLKETTKVRICAFKGEHKSATLENTFVKRDKSMNIILHSEYANQYAANGKLTLIDGMRGGTEYRTGDWQGYWAKDLVVEVAFDEPRSFKRIGLGCLEDTKSWIFLPSMVMIEGSLDGVNYQPLGMNMLVHTATSIEPAEGTDFWIPIETQDKYKKIRISASNYGKCPSWHLGSGSDTWLFVDEILFD